MKDYEEQLRLVEDEKGEEPDDYCDIAARNYGTRW